ncbi:Phospholipid hydroperoxide glutathione peroxidase 1 isoform 2 [Theobroma cacao]|uniref:Phospholipid hydroperoxide glutathione peroxidase 1 isoform 2 n=1 Tax=Theobroma cacao TaxID=3641 RepID=A0A061GQB2_THECC|nr:Phospholipid hydroperoxide glutathione peroxidase 1 isoform 2 [Theobroma cacao]
MASMPFSATFPSYLHDLSQTKKIPVMPSSWPFSIPSIESSLGSSKSGFLQHGFSLQSSSVPGFVFKSRSSGIYARAATEKTLYDYTVKRILMGRMFLLADLREKFSLLLMLLQNVV